MNKDELKKESEKTKSQMEEIKTTLNKAIGEVERLKGMLNQATGAYQTFEYLIKKEDKKDDKGSEQKGQ